MDKNEIFDYLAHATRACCARPIIPAGSPGQRSLCGAARTGIPCAVINLQGRTYMPATDCPFRKADEILESLPIPASSVRFVDFHAEVTSEKMAMGWYLDGRVSAVIGTHTHIPTADTRILPGGTAYQTDAGMTGPYDSVIGVDKEIILRRFLTCPARPHGSRQGQGGAALRHHRRGRRDRPRRSIRRHAIYGD